MASRTRTVNPRTRQNTSQRQTSPQKTASDGENKPRNQQKNVHRGEGFTVVEPDMQRRQKVANAAAREEAAVRQHHAQRRQEVIQSMNQAGQTAHRLGGGALDMAAVRRRQVEQAEAALRRAKNYPGVSPQKET